MPQLVGYIFAILGPLAVACGALAYLEHYRPDGWNSNTTATILGMCTAASTQLVVLVKSINNGQIGKENSTKLDHLHTCVETRADEIKSEAAEAKKAAVVAKDVAADVHQQVMTAINGGVVPKEVHVTVERDGQSKEN